jgi:sn-glycerol 3-phosphate transport system ATP-binding protein
MATVSLNGVRKSYGGTVEVIQGIDMEITDGEFVVIVGPSGCGKSTLLRMVAGLEKITGGEISIDGRVVNGLEPKDRDIAMVFQNYALYPHMSVYDNMAYGLRIRGMSKAEIDQRVKQAAATLELGQLLERKPRQLSGGQRQRVAMGRAIVREPKAFLFDEPLSNLDAKLRVQMRVEIKKLQRQLGVTSIYVTHDQVEAMTMADRLIVMNKGVAEQIGTPIEVYAAPASLFVAGFIGSPSMNFLETRVAADGTVALDGARLTPKTRLDPGRAVTVGIRPEHLAPGGGLDIRVELVELLGADTLVHGRLSDDKALIVRLPGDHVPTAGDRLPLRALDGAWHIFDTETGKRLGTA